MPAMFQVEGIIGTQNNDTITGDAAADGTAAFSQGNNWLIGGSGNDKLQGNGGNDVIIGDGIRLDSLIGTYSGTYTMYDAYADANYRNYWHSCKIMACWIRLLVLISTIPTC